MHKVDGGWLLRYGVEAGKALEQRGMEGVNALKDAWGEEGQGRWPIGEMGMESVQAQISRMVSRGAAAAERTLEEALRPGGKGSSGEIEQVLLRETEKVLERFEDELGERVMLVLDRDASTLYDECAFDGEVQSRLHEAMFDIMEAQKCFALERHTACVYHLMKVLERGLRGIALRVPGVEEGEGDEWFRLTWVEVLKILDKEMKKKKKDRASWFDEKEVYLNEVRAQMGAIRVAWRNPTMHLADSYSGEEAREIFDLSRGLMRRICLELKS